MIKHKKYISSLLLMAISISFMNYTPVFADSESKTAAESYYEGEGTTGKDKNNITWSYEKEADGTLSIWQHDELSGNVEIPEKIDGCVVSKIKKYGFSENEKITSVKIPSTVVQIGSLAFFGCKNLSSIEIPSSVISIGDSAFENTSWIDAKRKADPYVIVNNILIDGRNASGDIVIPDNVVEIADSAFAYIDVENKFQYGNGQAITSLKIPVGVKKIGANAFANSPNLTHIEIPITVTEVGAGAFSACPIDVIIPNKNAKIENVSGGPDLNHNIKLGNEELKQGWYSNGQNWYWLYQDGSVRTSWYYENGNWYYFYGNGQMATGFINLNGAYYYLDESSSSSIGIMKTGWQKINGNWYYFNRDSSEGLTGLMAKGWKSIDGNWYYFYGDDGTMAHDTWIGQYYVNSSGVWVN